MVPLEMAVLEACDEAVRRRHEMLPLLAAALGVPPGQVFYAWVIRRCEQGQSLADRCWEAFFHGFECDLRHRSDGRLLRFDFGPGGSVDTMTSWGVLQFIMTARPPWREFPELREQLARSGPPYDAYCGDFNRFCETWGRLEKAGLLAAADPELVDLVSRSTSVEGGLTHVRLPEGLPDEVHFDCMVAGRQVLTSKALGLLQARRS